MWAMLKIQVNLMSDYGILYYSYDAKKIIQLWLKNTFIVLL